VICNKCNAFRKIINDTHKKKDIASVEHGLR